MPSFCAAFNCSNSSDFVANVMFHKFPDPEKDKIRYQKWIHAIKRKNFTPTKHSRLCSVHFKADDYLPPVICGPLRLKNTAVPSVFDFPDHLQPKENKERRVLVRVTPTIAPDIAADDSLKVINEVQNENVSRCKDVGVQTTLTGIELVETLAGLRRENRNLKQQLQRRDDRINTLTGTLKLHKKTTLQEETDESIIV